MYQNKFITFHQTITLLSFSPSVFLPLLFWVQEHELSYGFWFDLISFSPLLFSLFVRLCYFSIFMLLFFPLEEKKRVTFFVFKVSFFYWHQIAKGVKCSILFFSVPPSQTLTSLPTCTSAVPNSQLACSRYPSLPPHKWPWYGTVFIHEPLPPLLSSLLHVLML